MAYPLRPLPQIVAGVDTLPDWGDYHFRSVHETEVPCGSALQRHMRGRFKCKSVCVPP